MKLLSASQCQTVSLIHSIKSRSYHFSPSFSVKVQTTIFCLSLTFCKQQKNSVNFKDFHFNNNLLLNKYSFLTALNSGIFHTGGWAPHDTLVDYFHNG